MGFMSTYAIKNRKFYTINKLSLLQAPFLSFYYDISTDWLCWNLTIKLYELILQWVECFVNGFLLLVFRLYSGLRREYSVQFLGSDLILGFRGNIFTMETMKKTSVTICSWVGNHFLMIKVILTFGAGTRLHVRYMY